jgi:hypothetical protein
VGEMKLYLALALRVHIAEEVEEAVDINCMGNIHKDTENTVEEAGFGEVRETRLLRVFFCLYL